MVWQKELLVLAVQGMKLMHVYLYSLYRHPLKNIQTWATL
jgi:hypothetical protein